MQSQSNDTTSDDSSQIDPEVASALQELFALEALLEHSDAEE